MSVPRFTALPGFPSFSCGRTGSTCVNAAPCLATVLESCAKNHRTPKCSFNWVTSQWLANRFHMLLDCPPLYASSAFFLHSSFWAACLRENNYIWSVVKWPRSCCYADWQCLMQIDGFLLWKSPWLIIHRVLSTIVVWIKTQAPLCIFPLSFLQSCWC